MSETLRAVVIDDEPLARAAVRGLLERDPEITVSGECSGIEAVELITRARPHIVFVDVQMPEVDGFQVIESLPADQSPVIVFITAYDEYALRAFDVHAIDYLLKPFDDARFVKMLAHAKERARAAAGDNARILALLSDRGREKRYARRFLVRTRDKTLVITADEIDWIEAADYYVSLHVGGKSHLLRETMTELETRLDPEKFFRAHRSAIVNVDRIREVHPLFRGDCALVLESGARVRLSRTRRADFEQLFNERSPQPA